MLLVVLLGPGSPVRSPIQSPARASACFTLRWEACSGGAAEAPKKPFSPLNGSPPMPPTSTRTPLMYALGGSSLRAKTIRGLLTLAASYLGTTGRHTPRASQAYGESRGEFGEQAASRPVPSTHRGFREFQSLTADPVGATDMRTRETKSFFRSETIPLPDHPGWVREVKQFAWLSRG